MFFPKADGWTVDDARKWFIARQFQILENPAVPENDTAADVLDTDGSIPIEQRSKKDMLKKALVGLTEKDKERLKKARSVISVLLNGKSNVQDQQTQGKITMRKINQAIRILMEVKK